MRSATFVLRPGAPVDRSVRALDSEGTLVLAFAGSRVSTPSVFGALRDAFPRSKLLGCSTAGEILQEEISDGGASVAVIRFDRSSLRLARAPVAGAPASFEAGRSIARDLHAPDLRAVFILSDGLNVNGTQLVRGLGSILPEDVVVTGGLAGDGDRFESTWIFDGEGVHDRAVAAVGIYGDRVVVGHGSRGGWDTFGPPRLVTRAEGNVLHELNGNPALSVYRQYLGEMASGLPATALLFPLAIRRTKEGDEPLVRTVLKIDDATQSMTFAGDIPDGSTVQFMRASFERLIDGAAEAASLASRGALTPSDGSVSIAISCVGRRLVLGERAEEEVESALEKLPAGTKLVGFYSYGEISPYEKGLCDLHNQTMTLTTITELAA